MTTGSVLTCFSWFSQYLNHFNSDFDPWIVVGIIIWWPNHDKGFWGISWVNYRSNLVKIAKNLWGARVWYKTTEKVVFVRIFYLVWPSVNLGLTKGILVEKGTLSFPVSKWVMPCHYICTRDPVERKWYFWVFQVPTRNWRVDKIQY